MGRYRKKPVVVEAIQWPAVADGVPPEVEEFLEQHAPPSHAKSTALYKIDAVGELWIYVVKSETFCHVEHGGWIIAEPDGRGVYPCTAVDFVTTYEPAD